MSQEDNYRFTRQSSRDNLERFEEDESAPKAAASKTRQQRFSVIHAERSPHMDFTQTPFGNDDMFNACFDDCEGEEDTGPKRERKVSRVHANNTWFTEHRKYSLDMPSSNGKLVKRREAIETGLNDPYENEFCSSLRGFPRRNSEFFNHSNLLTRSFQHEVFGRYPSRYDFGIPQSKRKTYEKWSHKNVTVPTSLSDIYRSRKMPQTYEQIKQSCLRSGRLYEDPDFEAIDDNVFTSRRPPRPFVWRRPTEMVENPILVDAGASRMDVAQGRLGDCWFLAGIASLTQYPVMFKRVCPIDDQSFGKRDYCGAFHFNFWQGGEWVEVIIDDRLPTINNQLIFVHSKSRNEFWSALMEKAYAKMCGSYEALKGGQTSEAMEDFTGGMTESFDLGSKTPKDLFKIMSKAMHRQSLMGCSINAKPNQIEAKLDNGLVMGHAYTVTGVRKVQARTRSGQMEVELVRVRNPWGNEREWTGAWGDKSSEWNLLSDKEKKDMELTFDDDGEFWMSYRDFISNFQRLEICMLSPDVNLEDSKVTWAADMHKDRWRTGATAGGCRNNPNTFHKNPQFRVTLTDVDDDDDDDTCTLIVSLMQIGRRKLRRKLGANSNLTIGFAIYKLEEEDLKVPRLDKDYFLYHASTARSNTFINARELTNRFKLKPGVYCIVPSTFDANEEGDFLVRLFSEKEKKSDIQDEQTRITRNVKPRITASEDTQMDSKYRSFFDKIAGQDGQVDSFELKKVLDAAFSKDVGDQDFNIETCRSLITMYDDNGTGKLEYDEFKQALVTAKQCHSEFKKYDKDRSGALDMYELEDVLDALGVKMSKHCLTAITCRYSNKKGTIDFDDFLQIYTRIIGLIETFNKHTRRGSSQATFSLDDFIEGAVGL